MLITAFVTALLLIIRFFGEPVIRHYTPEHVDRIEHFVTIGLIVCIAVFIDRLGRRFYWEGHVKRRRGRETPKLLQDLVTILIVAMSVAVGLWWQEGLTLTGIAATSIGVAAAIGVALQPDIQDVFSGLAMNYEDTCAIGDWITIQLPDQEPVSGRVSGLSWRSAFITMEDGSRGSIPNHIFTSNPVVNHSRPRGAKQIEVKVPVDVRVPSERVREMLLGEAFKAVRSPGLSRQPPPEVLLTEINSDAGIYAVRFWYDPDRIMPIPARSVMLFSLQKVLLQHELPLPVTQIELTPPPELARINGAMTVREALSHVGLFRTTLNNEQLDALAGNCNRVEFARNDVLMRQGDPAESMYLLLEGATSITINTEALGPHEVAVSAAGDVVGEMSLMTGAPRTATATALTRLSTLKIDKRAIEELLKASPSLFEQFSRFLAQRQLENAAAANTKQTVQEVESDILAKMMSFFSRAFRARQS
ncbi:MAG TPA: mechanosensitive ion channel family protein [Rhizomicrobium sp.]|nr:mechanosensitive ion channel family protein [Rhizomicrobium sp.]